MAPNSHRDEYAALEKRMHEMRNSFTAADLAAMSQHGFLLAHQELAAVLARLGNRQRDIEELHSIGKSMDTLLRKMSHLAQRLAPDLAEGEDIVG